MPKKLIIRDCEDLCPFFNMDQLASSSEEEQRLQEITLIVPDETSVLRNNADVRFVAGSTFLLPVTRLAPRLLDAHGPKGSSFRLQYHQSHEDTGIKPHVVVWYGLERVATLNCRPPGGIDLEEFK